MKVSFRPCCHFSRDPGGGLFMEAVMVTWGELEDEIVPYGGRGLNSVLNTRQARVEPWG